ncbi:hypothetical protein BCR33DRAFT_786438 [Rhizoclosmatium globosum]|uniref:SAM domain-containing protein n=1 Tax=Rhizoclosmatium globosum TaxID=329046 RepID=A0A1Y2C5A5_9FUNG|nr:hypothetical protein BCR33DRAFT_786438 [Rhizoclosmatium globosum]|eukprot:ORY42213.1 hypothetical protein BCR33DRAFT_786438 [Rhizoclosmatium globosum]
MSQLIATILFPDSNCTTANSIQYFSSNNSCPETPSKCVKATEDFYMTNLCVPTTVSNQQSISIFGKKYFPDDVTQVLSLSTGDKCGAGSVNGAYAASKVTVNSTGALLLSTYLDRNCTGTELKDVLPYGSVDAPSCQGNNTVSVINNHGYIIVTSYTGSDCQTPISVEHYVKTESCQETSCYQHENGNYVTYKCAKTVDPNKLIQLTFNGAPTFKYTQYEDSDCRLFSFDLDKCLNTCYSGSLGSNIQSANTSITDGGSSVQYSYYSKANCQGQLVDTSMIPTDGTCTNFETVVFNKVLPPNGTPSTPAADSGNSNVGVIAGAVMGSLVLIGLFGFITFWVSKKKSKNNLQQSPVTAAESSEISSTQPVSITSSPESTGTGTFANTSFLVNNNSDKKTGGFVFDAMNSLAACDAVGAKMPTIGIDGLQYTDFGDVRLPSIPSRWTVSHVMLWASRNGATPEILALIQNEQLDGQAFLLMKMDDFNFQFPSLKQRLYFRAGLESLAVLNEERLKTAAIASFSAPPYEG